MDHKKERLLKLVNMAENGTEEEKATARKKIAIYVNRFGYTRKDLRNEKTSILHRLFNDVTHSESLEYANTLEKAKIIAAFIEDNEYSIQAFLNDYNHTGLVNMITTWLEDKN